MENEIEDIQLVNQNSVDQIPANQNWQANIVPPNLPKSPQNKLIIIILVIALLIVLGLAGFFGYKYYQLFNKAKLANEASESTLKSNEVTPTPTIIPSLNSMADWETYENKSLGFRIKYPPSVKIEKELDDQYNRAVLFSGDILKFEVMLRSNKSDISLDNYFYMDFPVARKIAFLGKSANVYELPNGYCDGPGCSDPSIAIVTENNLELFHISFIGDAQLSELEKQILDTFEFLDSNDVVSTDNNDPRKVANDYLTAYVNKDWIKAKEICPSLEENIAEGYGFAKFEVTGSIPDENGNYYVYVKFTNEKGEVFDKSPHSNNPLQILMSKDENGVWKVLTWYFYE